ncbi:MAG: FkbM family methyltransferase [Rhizobium sp.]|nr:MAG: FkbM family methyltransferase [Rhizobium sp.]
MSLLSNAQPASPTVTIAAAIVRGNDAVFSDEIGDLSTPIAIDQGQGRGIVIPGGGAYLQAAWVTIRMIRHFGCDLPIELWLLPWETVDDATEFLLGLHGVEIRTATPGYCQDFRFNSPYWGRSIWLAGWQLKVQAVLQSRFREVVFLDADCYPVTANWLHDLTAQPGTFVGDIIESDHLLTEAACHWLNVSRGTPVDSGAFFVDKSDTAWCEIVAALNGLRQVRRTYNRFWGDKDTWWIAHALAGVDFTVLPRGRLIPPMQGIRHQNGLLHRTGDKFTTDAPGNTPQHGRLSLEGDELTSQFLRSWPPLTLRHQRDWEIVSSVLELDEYRLQSLGQLDYVIDAGGHVGSFGAAVLRRWPAAKVIAFEPSPDNAKLYRLNAPGVELHQLALGLGSGTVSLTSEEGDTAFMTIDGDDVKVAALSEFVRPLPRVDLLKIDIEGDEDPVFADLCKTGEIRKVQRIVGEWHDTQRLYRIAERLRATHHLTLCVHHWEHGYFEAVRNDQ